MGVHTRIMPAHLRRRIELEVDAHLQRVELLIARLDAADPDPDLEEESDYGAEERGEPGSWPEGDQGGVNAYPDDDHEDDDHAARKPHRARVQRDRCEKRVRYGVADYRLRGGPEPAAFGVAIA